MIKYLERFALLFLSVSLATNAYSQEYLIKLDKYSSELSVQEIQSKISRYVGGSTKILRKVGDQTYNVYLISVSDDVVSKRGSSFVLSSLKAMPGAVHADPNINFRPSQAATSFVPSDPLYNSSQASYLGSSKPGGIQMDKAWAISRSSYSTTIAVLDTGILFDHPDLKGRIVPGYSFYRNSALDHGIKPGPDASDPGDYLTDYEKMTSSQCNGYDPAPSDWHGTRVASAAAASSNTIGMVGTSHNAKILPVRVLGPCGAALSDVLDGLAWSGGFDVSGVPKNPNPAKIITLSFNAGDATCPASLQSMIDKLLAAQISVVTSAGNENKAPTTPAVCKGVVSVGASTEDGLKAGYSNYDSTVTVYAPGGNQDRTTAITTATNTGTQGPSTSYIYGPSTGTSFSAPIVAGVIANMISANPSLTPSQIATILKSTSSNFASGVNICQNPNATNKSFSDCACTKTTCGSGILNAFAATNMARQSLVVANVGSTREIIGSTSASLDGSLSSAPSGKTLAGFNWSVLSGSGSISNPGAANITVNAQPSSTPVVLRLTVTDSSGQNASADSALLFSSTSTQASNPPQPTNENATTPANQSSSSGSSGGSGGGGQLPFSLIALLGLAMFKLRKGTTSS